MMDFKSNRQKFYAALRSGKYKQGKGMLSYDGAYCAVGVAAVALDIRLDDNAYHQVSHALNIKRCNCLWIMNDSKEMSLTEIADELEHNETKYFKPDDGAL